MDTNKNIKIKISIIVPVYQVEQYVGRCLESIIHQNLNEDEYEIIVINDGTKDGSWDIVKSAVNGHNNIRLFEQHNQGLSATRNHGFDLAKGEYIWCIDSDDYIKENCLNEIYQKAKGNDLLIQTTYIPTGIDTEKRTQFDAKYNLMASEGKDLLISGFLSPSQFYIYRTEWLKKNSIRFCEGLYHEDMEFTPKALFLAHKIAFLTEPVYFFYKRPGSITTTFNPKRTKDVLLLSLKLRAFYLSHKKEKHSDYILIHACKCIIYGIIISKQLTYTQRNEYIKNIISNKELLSSMHDVKCIKYNIQYLLMRLFPFLYLKVFDKLYSIKYYI